YNEQEIFCIHNKWGVIVYACDCRKCETAAAQDSGWDGYPPDNRPDQGNVVQYAFSVSVRLHFPGSVRRKRRYWDRGSKPRRYGGGLCREESKGDGVYQRKFEIYPSGQKGAYHIFGCYDSPLSAGGRKAV